MDTTHVKTNPLGHSVLKLGVAPLHLILCILIGGYLVSFLKPMN